MDYLAISKKTGEKLTREGIELEKGAIISEQFLVDHEDLFK